MTISDNSSKHFWTREMAIQCITTLVTRFTATCKVFDFFAHNAKWGFPASTSMLHMHTLATLFCLLYFQLSTKKYFAAIHVHGKKNFYCFSPYVQRSGVAFPDGTGIAKPNSDGLMHSVLEPKQKPKLALERLSAFHKSTSSITYSTIAPPKLACVGIHITAQCGNSTKVFQYAAVPYCVL